MMTFIIDLLGYNYTYIFAAGFCFGVLMNRFKQEKSPLLFKSFLLIALLGNGIMYGALTF